MILVEMAAAAARLAPPETAHRIGVRGAGTAARLMGPPPAADPILETRIAGLTLPNPVGLAAGFDKDAEIPDAVLGLGFGFVEVGTITPRPQPGNPKPRMFRLVGDRALINRFGFNSRGLAAATTRLTARQGRPGVIGVNLGANHDSPDRIADYVAGDAAAGPLATYVTINVSSPNTAGLRGLQDRDQLRALLDRFFSARAADGRDGPVFLKVAPDLDDQAVDEITAEVAAAPGVSGLIVSNTTVSRPGDLGDAQAGEKGGLSGRPLFALSTDRLARFRAALPDRIALIGAGGVEDADTAYAKIRAGAQAVQLYTALVYRGPRIARRIAAGLAAKLRADGFNAIAEAVGRGAAA